MGKTKKRRMRRRRKSRKKKGGREGWMCPECGATMAHLECENKLGESEQLRQQLWEDVQNQGQQLRNCQNDINILLKRSISKIKELKKELEDNRSGWQAALKENSQLQDELADLKKDREEMQKALGRIHKNPPKQYEKPLEK